MPWTCLKFAGDRQLGERGSSKWLFDFPKQMPSANLTV